MLPFDLRAYQLCLDFFLFCRLCHEGQVPKEIGGRPSFMLHPIGTLLLMMRLFLLVSKRLEFWGDDIGPTNKIPMETCSRRWHSIETISASSKSRTISSGASSRRMLAIGKRTSRGETPAEELLFDIEVDFSGDDMVKPNLGTWRRSLRLRFSPRQAGVNAYTKGMDDVIRDTHLQRRLKDHPFA